MVRDKGLTVKEIIAYRKRVKPIEHSYGKYGTLAKIYLEEHNPGRLWSLAGELPEYLHGIDKQAGEMYEAVYGRLSMSAEFKKIGNYLYDLRIETQMQKLIEEEILNELVYTDGGEI